LFLSAVNNPSHIAYYIDIPLVNKLATNYVINLMSPCPKVSLVTTTKKKNFVERMLFTEIY